jgi:hypothetical protein
MQAALRPMNLGEILDKTFAIYRRKFWLFVGIAGFRLNPLGPGPHLRK